MSHGRYLGLHIVHERYIAQIVHAVLPEFQGACGGVHHQSDFSDFKNAIRSGTFSDEYNLTNTEVERLSSPDVDTQVYENDFSKHNGKVNSGRILWPGWTTAPSC